jgi:hypothetical protein
MKIIIYALLLVILSIGVKLTPDLPALMFICALAWCVSGFLLIKTILEYITNKKQ